MPTAHNLLAAACHIVAEGPIGAGKTRRARRPGGYLQAEPETLIACERRRGLETEQSLGDDDQIRLNEAPMRFFHHHGVAPVMVVNSGNLDFSDRDDDFKLLVQRIESMRGLREYFIRGD